jgi:hypothetical protein
MKCKKCKHWKNNDRDSRFTNPKDIDTDEDMKFEFTVKRCSNPKLLFCERPLESNGFSVRDGSDYFAALYTAENFGCVLMEEDYEN